MMVLRDRAVPLVIAMPGGITGAILGEGWPFASLSPSWWLAIPFWALVALAILFLVYPPCRGRRGDQ